MGEVNMTKMCRYILVMLTSPSFIEEETVNVKVRLYKSPNKIHHPTGGIRKGGWSLQDMLKVLKETNPDNMAIVAKDLREPILVTFNPDDVTRLLKDILPRKADLAEKQLKFEVSQATTQ